MHPILYVHGVRNGIPRMHRTTVHVVNSTLLFICLCFDVFTTVGYYVICWKGVVCTSSGNLRK